MTFVIFSTSSIFSLGGSCTFQVFLGGGRFGHQQTFFFTTRPTLLLQQKDSQIELMGITDMDKTLPQKLIAKGAEKNLQFCISPTYLGRSKIKPMVIKPMVPSSYHPLTVISLESDPSTQKWEETSSILASKSSNYSPAPTRANSNRNGCFRK